MNGCKSPSSHRGASSRTYDDFISNHFSINYLYKTAGAGSTALVRGPALFGRFGRLGGLGLLELFLGTGGVAVLAGLKLAVPGANLLFDFLGDQIDRRVEVRLEILRVKVRAGPGQFDGTLEFLVGQLADVVLDDNTCVDGIPVELPEFFELVDDMRLNRVGHLDVVGRQNQFHDPNVLPFRRKIQ